MSFRRPSLAAVKDPQQLLDVLCGLYDRAQKPSGGNLTNFIVTTIHETSTSSFIPLAAGGIVFTNSLGNLASDPAKLAYNDATGKVTIAGLAPGGLVKAGATGILQLAAAGTDYADPLATYWVSSSSHLPTNGVNLGLLASGVLQQAVTGGVSTPSVFAATVGRVPFGSGVSGGLIDNASLTFSASGSTDTMTVGGTSGTTDSTVAVSTATGGGGASVVARATFNTGASLAISSGNGISQVDLTGASPTNATGIYATGTGIIGSTLRLGSASSIFQINQTSTGGSPSDTTTIVSSATGGMILTNISGVAFAASALSTAAQVAFLQLQSMPGSPLNTPSFIVSGQIPTVVDSTHRRLYQYISSGWRITGQDDGALSGAPGLLKTDAAGIHSIAVSGVDFAPAGNYITALTGGVTAAGPGSAVATVHLDAGATVVGLLPLANITPSGTNGWVLTTTAGVPVWAAPTGGGGTVTNVTGTPPIAVATGTTTPVISLNIDGTLAVVAGNLGRAAISGDGAIAAGSNAFALSNIPNDTTLAGDLLATAIAAPASPSAGHGRIWFDSTALNLWSVNQGGIKTHTVTSRTAVAHQFLTGVTDGGSWNAAQPDYSDLTGSVPAITQLTGDVTAGPGSGSQVATLVNIPTGTTAAGNISFAPIAAPGTPGAGHALVYVDSTSLNFAVKNSGGAVNHGIQSNAGTAHKWVSAIADNGTVTLTQPAYADLAGGLTAGPGINLTVSGTQINLGSVGAPSAPTIAEFAAAPPAAAAAAGMQAAYLWDLVSITLTGTTHVTGNGLALASFAGPSITDASAVTVDTASTLLVTGPPTAAGSVTLTKPYSFWVASGATQLDGVVAVNGVAPPTNVSLIVGHATATDRDRVQFFVGGGSLGATGAGDNTFVDIAPTTSALTLGTGVAGGIYATQRIRTLNFTGGGVGCTVAEGASLYIDGAPTFTVAGGATWGIYVAGGGMHVGGAFECTTTGSAAQLIALGSAGTVFQADGNGPSLAFFGAGGAVQQTGGAASAGATYTATEQGMINRMYSALRTYGLLT